MNRLIFFTLGFITGIYSKKSYVNNLDFKQSYDCKQNRNTQLTLDTDANNKSIYFNMSAIISDFKVQAFEFKNLTTGNYQDSKLECNHYCTYHF